MKQFIILVLFFLGIVACQPSRETSQVVSIDEFILDSLLFFENEEMVKKQFGNENVSRDTASYRERDGSYITTVVYRGTNKEVNFTWNDSVTFTGLNTVFINKPGTLWKTSDGITIGTRLSELAKVNKSDVEFSGLGWDYGGRVLWKNGELQNRGLEVIVALPDNNNAIEDQLDSIMGDQIVSSKSGIAKKVDPVVVSVTLLNQKE